MHHLVARDLAILELEPVQHTGPLNFILLHQALVHETLDRVRPASSRRGLGAECPDLTREGAVKNVLRVCLRRVRARPVEPQKILRVEWAPPVRARAVQFALSTGQLRDGFLLQRYADRVRFFGCQRPVELCNDGVLGVGPVGCVLRDADTSSLERGQDVVDRQLAAARYVEPYVDCRGLVCLFKPSAISCAALPAQSLSGVCAGKALVDGGADAALVEFGLERFIEFSSQVIVVDRR